LVKSWTLVKQRGMQREVPRSSLVTAAAGGVGEEELQVILITAGEVELREDVVVVADEDDQIAEQGMVQLVVLARWRSAALSPATWRLSKSVMMLLASSLLGVGEELQATRSGWRCRSSSGGGSMARRHAWPSRDGSRSGAEAKGVRD
jgi:hypothetical protein